MRLRPRLLILSSATILVISVVFSFISYEIEKYTFLKCVDNKLYTAATFAKESLPDTYHDNIEDKYSVSQAYYNYIVDRNNELCLKLGLQYIWSVMVVDGNVVFTSATSPTKDIRNMDHPKFFEKHTSPEAFFKVLSTMKVGFSSFHNKWGNGRMVLVPGVDKKGRFYCFGASISINEVLNGLRRSMATYLLLTMAFLALGFFVSYIVSRSFSKNIEKITDVAKKISEGDLDQQITIKGVYELESLAGSINTMSASIRDKVKELERLSGHLEEEVEKKTTELLKAHAKLFQSEKLSALGKAAGAMAHEFRNQLGVIGNVSHYLRTKLQGSEEKVTNYLDMIQRVVVGANNSINNILYFARTRRLNLSDININEVIDEVLGNTLVEQEIELVKEFGDIPLIKGDEGQFKQLFFNLTINALQAMSPGGKLIINTFRQDDHIHIIFKDTGIGVDEEKKDMVFEPFFTTKFEGTGLGLSTGKLVVENHGGTISLFSEPLRGTTITIILPINYEIKTMFGDG